MAGKSKRSKLVLSDEDRAELEQLARSRVVPQREAQRSAILLGYYAGESIASIGRRLGMTRLSVSKWVAKALAVGPIAALKDNYHRPKEPVIGEHCQSLGGARGVLETEGYGLCGRKSGAGKRWPAISASMLSKPASPCLVPRGKSDGTSEFGGTAAASGESQILPGT